jgi:uncharacterized protein (TIGR02246 family)
MITIDAAHAWAARYFEAWKSNDRAQVASLFAEDAVYFYGPFREPSRGRDEIVERWMGGVQAEVENTFEVVAVRDDTAVIHWHVTFDAAEMDGVLIVQFDDAGQCIEHREWYAERRIG